MKSYSESHGIATFKALPHPLPEFVQNMLKNNASRLRILAADIERAENKVVRKQAVDDYNEAILDLHAQEEFVRHNIGIPIVRPVFRSIAPVPAYEEFAA